MFIQPAIIRKNTQELIEILVKLGWKPFGILDALGYDSLSIDPKSGEFEAINKHGIHNVLKNSYNEKPDVIDCNDNEILFIELASLRDDTNEEQWFVCHKDFYTDIDDAKNQLFAKEGDWILNPSNDALNLLPDYFHKATVEEILQYFS